MANLSIGGNVTDSVVINGDNNFVVKFGDLNGSVVNIIKPSDKPKYSAHPTPVILKPRAFPSLLDRENEFETIRKASQLSFPISVWGQQGVGKTSFIRHLAHTLDAGAFTSGMIYLSASGLRHEDLLQALFDSFFDSDVFYKPTTAEITRALQSIKALIFLDDLQIGRDETESILDAAPGSVFILSSTERSLWGEGEVISLRGLPESESLKLFERELSRPLNDQEKATAAKICSMLQGHPLQILQAASIAKDSGRSMESLLREIASEKTENKSMAYMNMASLSNQEKQILALLAVAGGNIVSLKHIKNILKDKYEQKDIQRLISLGLVQSHSPRFSITDALVSSISATWNLASWQDILLNYAINWLSQQPVSALVEESSGLLIHIIKNAGERKKWREVIQLGRALEKFLVFYKRWQTWSDILNLILTAAKALNDSKIQAWALHQLGSRALFLGHAGEAKTFLSQALKIRQAIGDKAGLAVTQHNLNILNGIIAPRKGNTSGCKKYLFYGFGAVAATIILATAAWVIFTFLQSTEPPIVNLPNTPMPSNTFILTIPPTGTPEIIFPTETPSPSPTLTLTITNTPTSTLTETPTLTLTPTITLTETPSPTFTSTATPLPVLLYDFVEHANDANWYQADDGSLSLEFFSTPTSSSPENYIAGSDYGYAGWDYSVPMIGEKKQKQVILAYPSYLTQVIGAYTLPYFDRSHSDAFLEVLVGYKDIPTPAKAVGVIFKIYFNEDLVFEKSSILSENPTIYIPYIPVYVYEGINIVRLEVKAKTDDHYKEDYVIWAVVKLWDRKP